MNTMTNVMFQIETKTDCDKKFEMGEFQPSLMRL